MAVNISEWSYAIRLQALGPNLNSRAGKGRIARQISQVLQGRPQQRNEPTPGNLQGYIDLYGEQVTVDAVADLNRFFQVTQGRGFTPGGLSTQLPPLSIGPGDVRASITAISVIGEGLAGWYLMQLGLHPLARPIGEGVDLIFENVSYRPTTYALIQVKTTQQPDILAQMGRAVPDLLQYAYNVAAIAPTNTYSCYIIGVIIGQSDDFALLSLKLDFV